MNVDREQENRMRVIGGGLITVGLGLVVTTVARLLQPGVERAPAWAIALLAVGGLALVTGLLLVIIRPKTWKGLWLSFLGLPSWRRETCIWRRCGLTCKVGIPKIDHQLSQNGQSREYSAKVRLLVSLSEKARDYLPLGISVDKSTTFFVLEQNRGLASVHPVTLEVVPGTPRETLLKTPGMHAYDIAFSASVFNNPSIVFVDLERPYTWTLKGITSHLANVKKTRLLPGSGRCTS